MHTEDSSDANPLKSISGLRHTSVGEDSHYTELFVGMLTNVAEPIQVGINVPLVATSVNNDITTGLGNIVPYVNVALIEAPSSVTLATGLQIEIPTVTNPALGDGHFLALPTVQVGWHPQQAILMTSVGWGQVLDGHHNHAPSNHSDDHHDHGHSHDGHHTSDTNPKEREPVSIVNPHASSELLIRMDLGYKWELGENNLRVTMRTDAIDDLSRPIEATVVQAGPVFGLLRSKITTEVYTLIPVTQQRRYQLRTGLRLSASIP